MSKASPRSPGLISIVVPVYNEARCLAALHARLCAVLDAYPELRREFVFVDDGSRDDSFALLAALGAGDPAIKALRFARNFGKESAMAAGLRAAVGDIVVLMDSDLQHPPEVIPEMIERWRDGAQMVTAVRRSRSTDPLGRRLLSRGFYHFFHALCEVEIPEGAGDYRLFDRRVVDAINALPERNRFMKGITSWVGFRQEEIEFEVAERAGGTSSFNTLRLLRYAIDGLSSFSMVPLRVWSLVGVALAGLSGLYGLYLLGEALVFGVRTPGFPTIMVSMLFVSGVQLISLGVIGEYVGRIFTEVKRRPLYLVADEIGFGVSAARPAGSSAPAEMRQAPALVPDGFAS
ncbi:glycosyltransferase family 2 protein [Ancylobacter dichloromethanicus]|uniref:Glycosyl transferase n=1 Tax=Ancylobacter dichloromethanicus TaxID=518825 RepID=A0A9W6JB96_9HYPH|nr:glycosyltransferase family 2 protein [Ancylobacter dichloromethanicus]MBS7553405.1 glycosyltransferase family 2 protein [Ancylobacter dichloromethanicus]GLK74326.1 glycosyl transferase [Ancylobacter dichloromethanicus]